MVGGESEDPEAEEKEPILPGFGKYRLVRKLAAGGMAQIYLATIDGPSGFSKTCVVKRILPQFANLEDFSEMFVTEAKVAALLNHTNIVQTFDFGQVGDQYYLAMEFVDGPSLDVMMRRAAKDGVALGVKLATHLGIPLCDALTYVQQMRLPSGEPLHLVHRDVTPGNILISRTAEVKLTDFGVVKTSVNSRSTTVGVLKGKFAYMSPEQLLQKPLDHRSDLFSLGVVLYEAATGRRLWKRSALGDLISAVTHEEVPRPTQFIPGFPPGFEQILLKALAKDPDDRYQSAREMMTDLDTFKVAEGYTNGRRELIATLGRLFPGAMPDSSYSTSWSVGPPSLPSGGKRPLVSQHPLAAPASGPPLDAAGLTGMLLSAEDFLALPDGGSLPSVGAWRRTLLTRAQVQLLLLTLGSLVATGLFWWRVLS